MDTAEIHARRRQPALRRYLPDLVYGANDGIVTTLVVIASIAGAAMSSNVILILGIANLLADGFSMGTSNVLAIRSALTAATRPSLWDASGNRHCNLCGVRHCRIAAAVRLFVSVCG